MKLFERQSDKGLMIGSRQRERTMLLLSLLIDLQRVGFLILMVTYLEILVSQTVSALK
ncbi:MAG TPA: hypothetical protein VI278_07380 [Nitrososphaeraceae archaeon]